jgi:hypothetical protein
VVVRYQFMDVHGSPDMTCEIFGAGFFRPSLGVQQVPPDGLVADVLIHGGFGGGRRDLCITSGKLVPPGADRLSDAADGEALPLRCSP